MDGLPTIEKPPDITPETNESVDSALEHLLQQGEELGVGKYGIVLKVDLRMLNPDERHFLVESKVIDPKEEVSAMAVKTLKIYTPGFADHEFSMQKRAREILLDRENVARIPDATTSRNQHINEHTRDYLNLRGAHLKDRAEFIVMDYIEGQDLGNMMYDFVLKEIGHEKDYIALLSYSQKEQIVGQELGFEQPDPTSTQTSIEKEFAAFTRNEERLFKYLKKQGFQLDPAIFEKVENAIRVLNKNGIYHNDLHKQNVMVGVDGEVYVIDFGRATSDMRRDDGIADTLFSKRWKALSLSEEEERKQIYKEEREQIELIEERMQTLPDQRKRIDDFIKAVSLKGIQVLERELALSRGSDVKFEQFLVMLHLASGALSAESNLVHGFIDSLADKGRRFRPFEINKINKLRQAGYLI